MPRLRVSHKLLAIFLLDMVTAVYLAGVVVREARISIDFARQERLGVAFLRPISDAFVAAVSRSGAPGDPARQRDAGTRIAAAARQLRRFDPGQVSALQLDAVLPRALAVLDRAAAPGGAFDPRDTATAITALRTLVQRIGDGSNLILDPRLDSYYAMSVSILRLPELVETLAALEDALRALPPGQQGRGGWIALTPRQQAQISGLDERLGDIIRGLDANLEAGYRGNADGSLRRAVDPPFRDLIVRLIAPRSTLADIADHGGISDAGRRLALRQLDIAALASAGPWQRCIDTLDRLLNGRITATRERTYAHLALGGLLLASTLVLVLIVAGSIATPIGLLAGVARRVRESNDYTLRANWKAHDEVGELIDTFNAMLGRLYAENLREQEMIGRSRAAEAQRALIEGVPVPLLVWRESDQRLLHVNPSATALLGVRLGDGDGLHRWLAAADRAALLAAAAATGAVSEFATAFRDASGEQGWAVISASSIQFEGGRAVLAMVTPINERRRIEAELIAAKDQAEAAVNDLREAQRNLVQAEKLASLGALVAGVAHEINTPIGIALTGASLLQEEAAKLQALYTAGEMTEEAFADFVAVTVDTAAILVRNVERATALVQSFKQVAVDQTSAERRRFDLAGYLAEIVQTLGPRLKGSGIAVEIVCPPGLEIDGFPGAFAQVITNIVLNAAIHAFDDGVAGQIVITAERLLPKDWIRLEIRDDGKGIAAEHLSRIFDPFFTTRRAFGGSGLGLHIVYNQVTSALAGTIDVSSLSGRGTTFTILFPRVREVTPN